MPLVLARPPEPLPAAKAAPGGKPLGYLAVIRREHGLTPVGSIGPVEGVALRDADWWSQNISAGAFVCELREVTR